MVYLLQYVDHHILRRSGHSNGSRVEAGRAAMGAGFARISGTLYDHYHFVK
jgi:hypothetical protein